MSKQKQTEVSFEAAVAELTSIVEELEQGEISLEQSLQKFERSVELTRLCQKQLQDAEQKVQVLSQDGEELKPYQDNK